MNKILVTARKARGVPEDELAEVLGLTLTQYKQLEMQKLEVTPDLAHTLATYFSLPPFYFTANNKSFDVQKRIGYLQKQVANFNDPKHQNVPPNAPLCLVTTVLELIISKEQLADSLTKQLELLEDFWGLTQLYEHVIALLENKSQSRTHKINK